MRYLLPWVIALSSFFVRAEDVPPKEVPPPTNPRTEAAPSAQPTAPTPSEILPEVVVTAPAAVENTTDLTAVTASRVVEKVSEVPQAVTVVTQKDIQRRQPNVAGEALREEAGVFLSHALGNKFKYSPIIRGRNSNRFVGFLLNGVRTTSAPLEQISIGFLERVEVIRGTAGSQYGGDAMAGVVNFITKSAHFSENLKVGGEAFSRYSSADNEFTEFLNFEVSTRKVGILLGASHQEFDDFRAPDGDRISPTSGISTDLYGEIALAPAENHVIRLLTNQDRTHDPDFYTQSKLNPSGAPRLRRILEDRSVSMLSWEIDEPVGFISKMRNTAYWQNEDVEEEQRTETTARNTIRTTPLNNNYFGGSTQSVTDLEMGRLIYGLEYRTESRKSRGRLETIDNATGDSVFTRVTGNGVDSFLGVGSAYLLSEWKVTSKFKLTAGARFETYHFTSEPKTVDLVPPFTLDDLTLDKRTNAATWNIGGNYDINDNLSLAGLVGTGFRVPNFGELLRFARVDTNTKVITVPNPDLEPETAITYQFGPRWSFKGFSGSVTGYWTQLSDTIVVKDQGTVTVPGFGTATARSNENSSSGYIRGIELEAAYRISKDWTLIGNYTQTRGEDTSADVPLDKIPPPNGVVGLRWDPPEQWYWAELSTQIVARFDDPSPADKGDVALSRDPALGSSNTSTNPPLRPGFEIPGYAVVCIRGGVDAWTDKKSDRKLSLTATINNAFNHEYRETFSTYKVSPGIDASLGIRFKF